MTAVTLGTDLPSLWALQGLFLFAVLIVCGASYPIERFYSVNLRVLVAGIALLAVIVAAQYMRSSATTTPSRRAAISIGPRRWNDGPLSAVSGDDALAFATAFYSEVHPVYARPFAYQHTWGSPRKTTLEKGWAALCFVEQSDCISWMGRTAIRAQRFIQSEFVVQSSLLGTLGAKRRVVALIVPPRQEEDLPRSPASSDAEDFSANRRLPSNPN